MRMGPVGPATVRIQSGDITTEAVDGIVNAANSGLRGGGGVDGAIHRAGGPAIMAECDVIRREQGGCPTGSAVITTAGELPCRRVIHAVGPIFEQYPPETSDALLAGTYRACLALAVEHGLTSLAFPSISTGVYGFPIDRSAPIVLRTLQSFLVDGDPPLTEIRLILFSNDDLAVYERAWDAWYKPAGGKHG